MNILYEPRELEGVAQSRESFPARIRTDTEFDDVIAITGIIEREIKTNGKFKDKLTDFSAALARTASFDVVQADTIVRDMFKARTGQTMKQMLDGLLQRERALFGAPAQKPALSNDFTAVEAVPGNVTGDQKARAYKAANDAGLMVSEGRLLTFNRAVSYEAAVLATELGVTEAGAKRFIKEIFTETENRDFWEWGKELDSKYFYPQVEAERQRRAAARQESDAVSRPRARI